MNKKRQTLIFFGFAFFLFSFSLQTAIIPGNSACGEVKQLSMGTATVGGIFYNIGAPVAQCVNQALPQVNITAEFTQGSTENLRLIDQKKMQLAVITPMIGYFARKGIKMFKNKPTDFRVIVRLLPNANVWTVLAKSKVKSIPGLKGYKVGVGPASGGLGVLSRLQLKANGINYKSDIKPYFLGAGAMAEAVKDGTIEAAMLTQELAEMTATTHKIRPLSWSEKELKAFLAQYPYFGAYVHPAGTFKGVDFGVRTADNGIQWICDKDMDENLVYTLAKTIVENLDCLAKIYAPAKAITPEWAASKLANPFHPGAIRYFKEKGLWK